MSAQDWVLLLLIVVLYCAFAGWLARFSVTMPMVLVLAGALTGPYVLGLIDIPATASGVERVAEVTLALLLFADAATLDLGRMRHHAGLTGRLLLIGLPLTVLLGAALAFALFPNEGLGFALLIAAILAPSDAALALPTSGSSRVPARILRTLRIESGLNDGIVSRWSCCSSHSRSRGNSRARVVGCSMRCPTLASRSWSGWWSGLSAASSSARRS